MLGIMVLLNFPSFVGPTIISNGLTFGWVVDTSIHVPRVMHFCSCNTYRFASPRRCLSRPGLPSWCPSCAGGPGRGTARREGRGRGSRHRVVVAAPHRAVRQALIALVTVGVLEYLLHPTHLECQKCCHGNMRGTCCYHGDGKLELVLTCCNNVEYRNTMGCVLSMAIKKNYMESTMEAHK